jgi:DNA polymerase III delta prime subunit
VSEHNTNAETFDVFLCHNSEDKAEIRNIARKLAEKGITPWLDEEQIRPGELWQSALGEQIDCIKSAAVFIGKSGLGPWQQEEMQAFLNEFVERKCTVIPVILSSAVETPDLPWPLKNRHRVDFRLTNPDPIKQLIWGITGDKSGEQPINSLPLVSGNPNLTDKEGRLDDWSISEARQYPAIVSPPEGEQRAQLLVLLDRVREYWVDGVLKHSLYNEVLISLGKRTMDQAVEPPWKHFAEYPSQYRHLILQNRNIGSVFDNTGLLLILGEPGSGKTTTMLELASGLIARAKDNPIERVPIVLNLSSWKKKQTLDEWIVEELSAKYRIPLKIGRVWLKNDYLLPLLDGLDEVNIALQSACVSAINEFIKNFEFIDKIGPSGLVVCCRLMEYRWLPERLKLNGAICMELLSSEEVNEFLTSGGSQLAGLRQAISADPVLQELSQTPLMLSIMSLAYEGVGDDDLAKEKAESKKDRRELIFNLYVERMFQRKGLITSRFSKDKVISWLAWLAMGMKKHSQSVFMVERLQPSWLNTRKQRVAYGTVNALIIAFISGLLFPDFSLIIFFGISFSLGCWSESLLIRGFISALGSGLIIGRIHGPSVGLLIGLLAGLIGGIGVESLRVISPVETMRWQWKQSWRKAIRGLIIGLIVGLIFGLAFPLLMLLIPGAAMWVLTVPIYLVGGTMTGGLFGVTVGGLLGGLTDTVSTDKVLPNQGIKLSLKNTVLSILTFGLAAVLMYLITPLYVILTITTSLPQLPLIIVLIGSLNRGGSVLVKHYSLRFILWKKGYTPFKFIKFLDHCAKLILLKKVGGGYMFIHRMLLDYFAERELKSTRSKGRTEETTR